MEIELPTPEDKIPPGVRIGVKLVMHNRENENIGYREPNIGYSIV